MQTTSETYIRMYITLAFFKFYEFDIIWYEVYICEFVRILTVKHKFSNKQGDNVWALETRNSVYVIMAMVGFYWLSIRAEIYDLLAGK